MGARTDHEKQTNESSKGSDLDVSVQARVSDLPDGSGDQGKRGERRLIREGEDVKKDLPGDGVSLGGRRALAKKKRRERRKEGRR